MKFLTIIILVFMFIGCGSVNSAKQVSKSDANKHILPPDTPSNKYSKTRQGG